MDWNPTVDISGLSKKPTQPSARAASATAHSSRDGSAAPSPVGAPAQSVTAQAPTSTSTTDKGKSKSPQPDLDKQQAVSDQSAPVPVPATATATPSHSHSHSAVATPKIPTSAATKTAPSSSLANANSRPSPDRVPLFLPQGKETDEEDGHLSSDLSEAEVDQLEEDGEEEDAEEDEGEGPVASTSAAKPKPKKKKMATTTAAPAQASGSSPRKRGRPSGTNGASFSSRIPPLPHYTVVRASKNSKQTPHKIIIHPGVTDGDRSKHVTGRQLVQGNTEGGRLNWYEEQSVTGSQHTNFRVGLGKQLAEKLDLLAPGPAGKNEHWVLDNWPDDYQFTVHHTMAVGGGKERTDTYVHGSTATAKFRTVNELTPHLFWLLTHGPNDTIRCACKYCTKKKQTEVNAVEGLQTHHGGSKRASSVASSSAMGGERKKAKLEGGYGGGAGSGFLADKTRNASKSRQSSVNPSKEKDPIALARKKEEKRLRRKKSASPSYTGSYVNKERDVDLSDGALYRVGELVWVELPKPFIKIKLPPSPHAMDTDDLGHKDDKITHWIAIVGERSIATTSVKNAPLLPGATPSITNTQQFIYRCKLLALDSEITRPESHVKAWLTHPPPAGLLSAERMSVKESVELAWDPQARECKRPKLEMIKGVDQAITPFALASQIAAHVAGSFSLVDRYKITPEHIHSSSTITSPEAAQRDALIARNYHYQCIWWGGERIWTGELVRLLSDPCIVTTGTLAPSEGAGSRSMFLRVSAIWKDAESEQAKLGGQLYELRDLKGVQEIGGDEGGSALSKLEMNGPTSSSSATAAAAAAADKGKSTSTLIDPHMPPPPPGFEFRLITPPGDSAHMDVEYLAGRYYQLPTQWRKREEVDRILSEIGEEQEIVDNDMTEERRAVAVAGLTRARLLFMTCSTWMRDRHSTIVDAEVNAQNEMAKWFTRDDSPSGESSHSHSHSSVNDGGASDSHSGSNSNAAAR